MSRSQHREVCSLPCLLFPERTLPKDNFSWNSCPQPRNCPFAFTTPKRSCIKGTEPFLPSNESPLPCGNKIGTMPLTDLSNRYITRGCSDRDKDLYTVPYCRIFTELSVLPSTRFFSFVRSFLQFLRRSPLAFGAQGRECCPALMLVMTFTFRPEVPQSFLLLACIPE